MKGIIGNSDRTIGFVELGKSETAEMIGTFDIDYVENVFEFCDWFNEECVSIYRIKSGTDLDCLGIVYGRADPKESLNSLICITPIDGKVGGYESCDMDNLKERMITYGFKEYTNFDEAIGKIRVKIRELNLELAELEKIRDGKL